MSAAGIAVGGVVGALLVAWHAGIYWEVDVKCEKPKHTVIRTLGTRRAWLGLTTTHAAELRRYAPVIVAEHVAPKDAPMRDALSNGFRSIAGFIFGKNVAPDGSGAPQKVAMTSPVTLEAPAPAKIAMTSPVTLEQSPSSSSGGGGGGGGGEYRVSFIMPSKFTLETLPRPVNPAVKIREVPARTMAALTWRGRGPREAEMAARVAALRAVVEAEGLRLKGGGAHLWQYHPPFAPPYMRVNEVLLEVDDGGGASASK